MSKRVALKSFELFTTEEHPGDLKPGVSAFHPRHLSQGPLVPLTGIGLGRFRGLTRAYIRSLFQTDNSVADEARGDGGVVVLRPAVGGCESIDRIAVYLVPLRRMLNRCFEDRILEDVWIYRTVFHLLGSTSPRFPQFPAMS